MKNIFFKIAILISLFSSCSLKYGTDLTEEEALPEFIFENSNFSRYNENVKTLELNANRLEQYKNGNSMYAKNVEFNIFDDNGALETTGSCGLMGADTNEKKYTLFDDIKISNQKDKLEISAQNLKWNGKTEQLISGLKDIVTIKKDNTELRGSGFSASGVTKSFSFTGSVSGSVETDENSENKETKESEVKNEN